MANKNSYVVVVGIDYSETGSLALRSAYEQAANRPQSELHIVNVVPAYGPVVQLDIAGAANGIQTLSIDEASRFLNEHAGKQVAELRAQFGEAKRPQRIVSHLRLDSPAEEIAQLASDLDADLVIVGTHGRRGVKRVLLGSVAERVVRLAHCPVLVVRPKGHVQHGPEIEPPCPRCLEVRAQSAGQTLWCPQHSERHGRRHTYHFLSRLDTETNPPLVMPQDRRE